ncbi:NUMOD3 domain-containing DNA-binding protein [Fibrella sp. ES10-3-2-2]|nr:hypothetical protein A6C57_01075 [Fibrella sp. ES10-3-2-2]
MEVSIIQVATDTQGVSVDSLSYVYIHRKADNQEVFYVGIGTGPKYTRAQNRASRSPLWKKVTRKHGRIVEIVAEGLTRTAANDLERDLISKYGRRDIGTGSLVNLTPGGEYIFPALTPETRKVMSLRLKGNRYSVGNSIRKGIKHTEESKKKMSLARKGKPMPNIKGKTRSIEQRQNISRACMGRPNANKGRTFPDSVRQKISLSHTRKRLVIDLQTGIYYYSIKEAATAFGIDRSYLRNQLIGVNKNRSTLELC